MNDVSSPISSAEEGGTFRDSSRFSSAALFWAVALGITAISVGLQLASLHFKPVIDDNELLFDTGPRGADPADPLNPLKCFYHPLFLLYYRPLFTASLTLGLRLHGAATPAGMEAFHRENLVLHGMVVALAFWMFRLLFRRDAPALLAGAIFALHPLQVCVTTFVGGRTDTLALFFVFWFVIGLLESERRRSGVGVAFWRILSLFAFLCALFTKEQCFLLALLTPLMVGPSVAPARSYARPWLLLYGIPIAIYAWAAHQVIPPHAAEMPEWSLALRIEMVGRTLAYYTHLFLVPDVGVLHRSTLGAWDTPQPRVAVGGYLVAAAWVALLWRLRANGPLRLLALWTTLTLLPCLNIIPIPTQFASAYRGAIPLVGLAGLGGYALDRMFAWKHEQTGRSVLEPAAWWIVIFLGSAAVWMTRNEVRTWQNGHTLMVAEVEGDPNFLPAVGGLAYSLRFDGRYQEALHYYDEVMARLFPGARTTDDRIAQLHSPRLRRLLKSGSGLRYELPGYTNVEARLRGGLLHEMGQYDAAIEDYKLALAAVPTDDEVRGALVRCYRTVGDLSNAIVNLRYLVRRYHDPNGYIEIATMYSRQERWAEAADCLSEGLANCPPGSPDRQTLEYLYQDALRRARAAPIAPPAR